MKESEGEREEEREEVEGEEVDVAPVKFVDEPPSDIGATPEDEPPASKSMLKKSSTS